MNKIYHDNQRYRMQTISMSVDMVLEVLQFEVTDLHFSGKKQGATL